MSRALDITGQRFGRLVALESVGNRRWRCACDCGTKKSVLLSELRCGGTQSCGCLRSELIRARKTTHGHYSRRLGASRTYNTWRNMITRCTNPNVKGYEYYGGRGITVCDRWRQFENFLADMGECPPDLEIDRIENDGNYEPGNCRWTTRLVNARNKRKDYKPFKKYVRRVQPPQCVKGYKKKLRRRPNPSHPTVEREIHA